MRNSSYDTVIIAHDYLCPWCWIGFLQAKRLREDYPGIQQDWHGFELLPESLGPLPDYKPKPHDPDAPPSRLARLAQAEGIVIPQNRTVVIVRTHDALQGAEYAKDQSPEAFDVYNELVYRGFWERSEDISDHGVLSAIAKEAGFDAQHFIAAIAAKTYSSRIVPFDDGAYAADVTHVPTFIFRGERCAEAPYSTIRDLAERSIAWRG